MYGNNYKFFKWWYAKDIANYGALLKEKTANLIAMTMDEEEVVQKVVTLSIEEDGLAVADCGPSKGRFYLTPNQMVSRESSLRNFWLVDNTSHYNTNDILGDYTTIEAGKAVMLPKGTRLFGKPAQEALASATVRSLLVSAIFPIGEGKYIAWERERNICTLIGDRETSEAEIKVLMKNMNY
jgi:hypothetical protein